MKLRALQIEEYRHLHNLNFEFTYPEGHANFGQPLKKICLIGQSATGKTSILEIIKQTIQTLSTAEILNNHFLFTHSLGFVGQLDLEINNSLTSVRRGSIIKNGKEYNYDGSPSGGTISPLFNDELKLLYFSAEIISKTAINIFDQNPLDITTGLSEEQTSNIRRKSASHSYIYEFGLESSADRWLSLLSKILDYRKKFTQMASEIINKGAIADLERLNKEYKKWAETNENPLISLSKSFNPILNKLNLELDLINTQYPIPIKEINKDETIPISGLSTGTKGLLLSVFPLHELDTTDCLILMDEPERSLFPDLQVSLISHYQKLAPKAQFMVVTHSPFIAAAFEPEERFILFFDKEGNVQIRRGESPIGDDPNDILANDFNIDYYNDFGKKAYQHYLDLKKKAAEEVEPQKKKELVKELSKLGDKYNF